MEIKTIMRGKKQALTWNRTFILLFTVNSMLTLGQFMINAILATYAESLGATESVIGLILSAFAVSSIIMRCFSGPMIDTYNKKRIVMIATMIHAAAFGGFGISQDIPLLFVFRVLQGCGMAFGNACCLAIVSQILPKSKYNSGIGVYSVAQVVAQSAGAPIGLWMVTEYGYRTTFMVSAAIMVLTTLLALQINMPHIRAEKLEISIANSISIKALLPAVLMFLLMVGSSVVHSFIPVYAYEKGIRGNPGLYFTVASLTMIATRPIVGKLTDRFGVVKVIIPALLCNIISYYLLSVANDISIIILSGFISAFGSGACQPAIQALSMKCVPPEKRGSASCTNFIGMDFGTLAGVSIAGVIAERMGYSLMWCIMTIPFFAGVIMILVFKNKLNSIENQFISAHATI